MYCCTSKLIHCAVVMYCAELPPFLIARLPACLVVMLQPSKPPSKVRLWFTHLFRQVGGKFYDGDVNNRAVHSDWHHRPLVAYRTKNEASGFARKHWVKDEWCEAVKVQWNTGKTSHTNEIGFDKETMNIRMRDWEPVHDTRAIVWDLCNANPMVSLGPLVYNGVYTTPWLSVQ